MSSLKELLQNQAEYEARLRIKDPSISLDALATRYQALTECKKTLETHQAQMNATAKQIGQKKQKGEDASALIQEMSTLKTTIAELEAQLPELENAVHTLYENLPNPPDADVPTSLNPEDNVCVRTVGPKPTFDFPVKNHLQLNEQLDLFDFQRGAKVTGSGWPIYKGLGAQLEWALLQLMFDTHIQNGYLPIFPPLLVKEEVMQGAGQLPKFASQIYNLGGRDSHLYMIPTSEVPLCGMHYDEILPEENLPLHYVAYSPCFRREAGAAGVGERGLIRMHQFNKVELFAVTTEAQAEDAFEKMVASAEHILSLLGLHYRVMLLCAGDLGFHSAKTFDIEVYLPGQDRYYEVSSISHCRTFQAQRSKIRTKAKGDKKSRFVHTLNGSGLATPRLMVALLETYQTASGQIRIPDALKKYLPQLG